MPGIALARSVIAKAKAPKQSKGQKCEHREQAALDRHGAFGASR
jgi:hypothetical protein